MKTLDGCYCSYLHGNTCEVCREQTHKEDARKVCESWNWNCTPRECASEATELEWSRHRLIAAMKDFGFKQAAIEEVVYEFDMIND